VAQVDGLPGADGHRRGAVLPPFRVPMPKNRIQQILDVTPGLALPGVFDALSARMAERAGFPLAFVSGYAVAATAIGEPDVGLLTQTEMIDQARRICGAVSIPVLVDADTGYGNPLNVFRTVRQLVGAGAAGCFLEDQVWPKKCGHMRGKQVVPRQDFVHKIRAAVEACRDQDFFIVARTDALAVRGMDEAVDRVRAARAAGAHASFIEAPETAEQLAEIGRRSPAPNIANMIHGGRTPRLSREELSRLGFQLILHPLAGLYSAVRAIEQVFGELATHGSAGGDEDRLIDFDQFNELIGLQEKLVLAERFGAG
jgi:methylisocitrate lyase